MVAIGFGFVSNWLKKWPEIFEPITWRSIAKPSSEVELAFSGDQCAKNMAVYKN